MFEFELGSVCGWAVTILVETLSLHFTAKFLPRIKEVWSIGKAISILVVDILSENSAMIT